MTGVQVGPGLDRIKPIVEKMHIRLRLIKLGTRVIETTSRIRLAFATACPDAALIRQLATTIILAAP
jgi:hypothetical protein